MEKVLIAGGTGLIGSNLIEKLKQKKYDIVLLSTQQSKANNTDIYYWQPYTNLIPKEALTNVTICINLCGAGIFDEDFTEKRKQELYDSRIISAKVLHQAFKQNRVVLKSYLGASAIGYYDNISNEILTEESKQGNWFLSQLVADWENAHQSFKDLCKNLIVVRIGIVLSEKGGFLKQLATPINYFVGAIPGRGMQTTSWIHIDDLANFMIYAIESNLNGTFNGVANVPETLKALTHITAKALNRPLWLPNIPVFMLKIIFGKRAPLLLSSQNVSNTKTLNTGFKFNYTNANEAINQLLK